MAKRTRKTHQKRKYQGNVLNEPPPAAIAGVLEMYRGNGEAVVAALTDIQSAMGHLQKTPLLHTAHALGVPFAQMYGTATFYTDRKSVV